MNPAQDVSAPVASRDRNAKQSSVASEARAAAVARKKALRAATIAVEDLQPLDILRMHALFSHYYDQHSLEQFKRDLLEKDHVILMRDRTTETIQGFSTLMQVAIESGGKSYIGIFSGDTVVAREYWGSPALGFSFVAYYWRVRLRNWMRPVYWFLITKGYKTYLLMANNFEFHYPRYESATPARISRLIDDFYGRRFNNAYDPAKKLIAPGGQSCRLKCEVAPIDHDLLKHPRIAFFQRANPLWIQGNELACVAKMNVLTPLKFIAKKIYRGFFGRR